MDLYAHKICNDFLRKKSYFGVKNASGMHARNSNVKPINVEHCLKLSHIGRFNKKAPEFQELNLKRYDIMQMTEIFTQELPSFLSNQEYLPIKGLI